MSEIDGAEMTEYLVFATVGFDEDLVTKSEDGVPEAAAMIRLMPVLRVPKRTTRAIVVDKAKAVVAPLVGEEVDQVRIRVVPVDEVTEAIVGFERQPRLVAQIVDARTGEPQLAGEAAA